jgi:hypothetical protein
MTRKQWFGARVATESGDLLKHALGRLLPRASAASALARPRPQKSPLSDPGADASWTASLNRGDDLPPCRLSVLIASGSRSAIRLEPFNSEAEATSRAGKM